MDFKNVFAIATAVVLTAAASGNLDKLQMWVWKAQARVIRESRTSNWGSPRFFPDRQFVQSQKTR
jgi:hypothetical protein